MKTTNEYLDHVKKVRGIASDYALAKLLNVTRHRVSGIRRGTDRLTSTECLRLALAGELDVREIIAAVAIERGDDETKKLWRIYVKKQLGQAAVCVAGLAIYIAGLLPNLLSLVHEQLILCQITDSLIRRFSKKTLASNMKDLRKLAKVLNESNRSVESNSEHLGGLVHGW